MRSAVRHYAYVQFNLWSNSHIFILEPYPLNPVLGAERKGLLSRWNGIH